MPVGERARSSEKPSVKQQKSIKRDSSVPEQRLNDPTVQRALLQPGLLGSDEVLQLQRVIGNQATVDLLSREEGGLRVQSKLNISSPQDPQEQEADRVAAQVVRQINSPVDEKNVMDDHIAAGAFNAEVHRQHVNDEPVASGIESSLRMAMRGGGRGLDDNTRYRMEGAFGTNFSGVKIHTDNRSDTLNRSLNARAFTTGQDVFFRRGEYNPGTSSGQELLAHELTHVVQQTGGSGLQRKSSSAGSLKQSPPVWPAGGGLAVQLKPATVKKVAHLRSYTGNGSQNEPYELLKKIGPKLKKGMELDVDENESATSKGDDWYKATYKGTDGFIRKEKVAFEDEAPDSLEKEDGAFSSFGDNAGTIGDGVSTVKGGLEKDELVSDKSLNKMGVASGSLGAISGLISMAQAIKSIKSEDMSKMDVTEGVLEAAGGAAGTAAGVADTVDSAKKLDGDESWDTGSQITGAVSDGIEAIKSAFSLIKRIYENWNDNDNKIEKSAGEKYKERMQMTNDALAAGASAVKTLKGFREALGHDAGGLSKAVPPLGIAISGANIAVEAYEAIRASRNKGTMQKEKENVVENFKGLSEAKRQKNKKPIDLENLPARKEKLKKKLEANKIKKDDLERILAKDKRNKEELNPIRLALEEGLGILREEQVEKLLKENKTESEIRAKIERTKKKLTTGYDEQIMDIGKYELSDAFVGLNTKRKNKSTLKIGKELVKIAADILTLSGAGAIVGAAMKAGVSAVELVGKAFGRIVQWRRDKKGGEKSSQKLFEKRKKLADLIFEMVGKLPAITNTEELKKNRDLAPYEKVHNFIEASGCTPEALYRLNGKVRDQYMLLMNSMKA